MSQTKPTRATAEQAILRQTYPAFQYGANTEPALGTVIVASCEEAITLKDIAESDFRRVSYARHVCHFTLYNANKHPRTVQIPAPVIDDMLQDIRSYQKTWQAIDTENLTLRQISAAAMQNAKPSIINTARTVLERAEDALLRPTPAKRAMTTSPTTTASPKQMWMTLAQVTVGLLMATATTQDSTAPTADPIPRAPR